jgi:hypothetical protein
MNCGKILSSLSRRPVVQIDPLIKGARLQQYGYIIWYGHSALRARSLAPHAGDDRPAKFDF